MPTTALPQDPDLGQLRRQARDLQRAARRGDPAALELIAEVRAGRVAGPRTARTPTADVPLADAQLVIARRYGFASWARLRRHVEIVTQRSWRPDRPAPSDESPADHFLRLCCLTFDTNGSDGPAEAARLLASDRSLSDRSLSDRSLSGSSIGVAAACADVAAVRRILAADPSAAVSPTGPHGWSPLLYQAYARTDPAPTQAATTRTAQLLLDHGADPNDGRFWHGLPTPFTVLTGVFGDGERDQPRHPHAMVFARLLLERGADPNDGQTLYNRMFGTDDDHLELLFEYGLGQPQAGPWYRLLGDQLESPQVMLRNLLAWAVTHDQRDRVDLLARHGVDIRSPLTELRGHHGPGRTPVELALLSGHRELAAELESWGAEPPQLSEPDAFVAAVMAGDAAATARFPHDVVGKVRRRRPGLMVWAASQGAPDAVELLAHHGFDVNALGRSDVPGEQPWQTPLHTAAERGDVELARRLLALGADVDVRDGRFDSTPADWARHFGHQRLGALLDAERPLR